MNTTVIKPSKGFVNIDFKEILHFRELLYTFAWRDIKVRYKQTVIGLLWAVIQPLATMLIYTIAFGKFAKMPSDGLPYPIFAFAGLLFWNLFSNAMMNASMSILGSEGIIKKIYFPRLIIPAAATVVSAIDFLISLGLFFGLMIYYQVTPTLFGILMLPVLMFVTLLAALGIGLFFSAVNVKYRDVKHALPFLSQFLMFATPVIYPSSIWGDYKWILQLNPMSGIIDFARQSLLGRGVMDAIDFTPLAVSLAVSLLLFIAGLIYFQQTERTFADII
ncbi:MAG: ABC transporter permease [Rhizobacter sp.]|nr:ABC transporter permease [Chlorobiales bacterium]